jgi:CHRD domain
MTLLPGFTTARRPSPEAYEETYLNIHTAVFPNGEIRGFLVNVPGPVVGAGLPINAIKSGGLLHRTITRAV